MGRGVAQEEAAELGSQRKHEAHVGKGMGLWEEMATEGRTAGLALDSYRPKFKSGYATSSKPAFQAPFSSSRKKMATQAP